MAPSRLQKPLQEQSDPNNGKKLCVRSSLLHQKQDALASAHGTMPDIQPVDRTMTRAMQVVLQHSVSSLHLGVVQKLENRQVFSKYHSFTS